MKQIYQTTAVIRIVYHLRKFVKQQKHKKQLAAQAIANKSVKKAQAVKGSAVKLNSNSKTPVTPTPVKTQSTMQKDKI